MNYISNEQPEAFASAHAAEIVRAYELTNFPIDVEKLANDMGISVTHGHLPENVSGAIIKEPGTDPVIKVSTRDGTLRQRFTIAHEIGHFVERAIMFRSDDFGYIDYRDGKKRDIHEIYADQFAACILMPEETVSELVNRGANAYNIAKYFGVSPAAATVRLVKLNLLG